MKRLYLLFLLIFIGCQREIDIEIPEIKPALVVNSLFSPDTVFIVHITHTVQIKDTTKNNFINNAKCEIYENNVFMEQLKFVGNGTYISTRKPQEGFEYSLRVVCDGYDEISASSCVPVFKRIYNIRQQDFAVAREDLEVPYSIFSFDLDDNRRDTNYYEFQIFLRRYFGDTIASQWYSPILTSNDYFLRNSDILEYSPDILPFDNNLFDTDSDRIKINILYNPPWLTSYVEDENTIYYYGDYILCYKFRHISKELYNYRRGLIKHLYFQRQDIFETMGDPVNAYSNVNNGYGIFAGYTQFTDSILVKDNRL